MSHCTTSTYRTTLVTYADVLKGKKPLKTRDPLAFPSFRRIHAQLNWRYCKFVIADILILFQTTTVPFTIIE